jgi:hypothetical protein
MIDKGLTYAYAEGGPVASEGRPRPNPFVRPMPILYFGPDGQPVYDNITVGGAAVMPEAIRRAVSNLDPEAAARAERIWASSIDPGGLWPAPIGRCRLWLPSQQVCEAIPFRIDLGPRCAPRPTAAI